MDGTFTDIQQGQGCPECGGTRKRTEEDYRNIAREKGIKWIGPYPANVSKKTLWLCSEGHKFSARYSSVYRGVGSICAGNLPPSVNSHSAFAAEIGLEWLGPLPSSKREKQIGNAAQGIYLQHRSQP